MGNGISVPGVGTTILAPESSGEGFVKISPNKTLFINRMTFGDIGSPEIQQTYFNKDTKKFETDISTLAKVFTTYKPNCDIELDKEDGSTKSEHFDFWELADFGVDNLSKKSPFLKSINTELETYQKIMQKLGSNKPLMTVLQKPEAKAAFIAALRALAAEIPDEGAK